MAEEADDLMKELNGEKGPDNVTKATKIVNVDVVPEAPAEDPLDVKPQPRPSATAALDAKHSTAAGGQGYAVTVVGDFYVPAKDAPGKKVLKPYKIQVNLPHLDGALSVIKNRLLDVALRKKHGAEGYLGYHTHHIEKAVPLGNSPAVRHLQYMDRAGLEAFIADERSRGCTIDASFYRDVEKLRNAVMDYAQNPQGFEKREAARQADLKTQAELEAMNPDLVA